MTVPLIVLTIVSVIMGLFPDALLEIMNGAIAGII